MFEQMKKKTNFSQKVTEKNPIMCLLSFQLLKLRKICGKNWGKQDWWIDVTNKILKGLPAIVSKAKTHYAKKKVQKQKVNKK